MRQEEVEQVLVVSRGEMERVFGSFHGVLRCGEDQLAAVLEGETARYMDRPLAEEDPGWKQLIPYVVVRDGTRLLHYLRGKSGGETRLHAKGSIGIGGHVNPVDGEQIGMRAYAEGLRRELREELGVVAAGKIGMIGVLNDDTNPVGAVHLGVVHLWDWEGGEACAAEAALHGLGWVALDELAGSLYERLETWSQLVVDVLKSQDA